MRFFLSFLILTMISCGSSVITDYDTSTDFSGYQTYGFYPSIDSGLSNLDDKRIQQALDTLLYSRGLVKSERPDLLVNYFASQQLSPSRSSIGIGIGGGGGNVGVGVSGGVPIGGNNIEQRLTLDFIDRYKDQLVWQAVAESSLPERSSAKQKKQHYSQVIKKMLKKFPVPNTKK
jgi:hypothetical protein